MKSVNISSYVGVTLGFREFTILLQDTLLEMNYSYTLSEEINYNSLNIIIGSTHIPNYYLRKELPSDTILVNLEQLYDGCFCDTNGVYGNKCITLLSKYRVWDYSQSNIKWLETKGIKAELFRRHWSHQFEMISSNRSEEIDVLFFGSFSEKRREIKEELEAKLPDKKICFHLDLWGLQRDEAIAKSKIVLNIHGLPSNVFETSRVVYLLSNKKFVISELSVDDNDYPELDGGLIRVPFEQIVETVIKYLELPEERSQISKIGYKSVKNYKNKIPPF